MNKFERENCIKCKYVIKGNLGTKEPSCDFPLRKGFPPCLKRVERAMKGILFKLENVD